MKFKDTPEEQKLAGLIVGAMREGYLDRVNQVPAYTDKDGVPVYRVLLFGLRWRSDGKGTGGGWGPSKDHRKTLAQARDRAGQLATVLRGTKDTFDWRKEATIHP